MLSSRSRARNQEAKLTVSGREPSWRLQKAVTSQTSCASAMRMRRNAAVRVERVLGRGMLQ